MMKANKIKVFHGRGTLIDHKKVRVDHADYEVNFLTADKIIFATGSKPFVPPIPGADHPHVHTSDTIFDLSAIPETMVIVGGGIIGVECAAIYSAIGSKVTIVEMQDRILSTEDADVSKTFSAIMKREGVDVFTEHQAVEINETDVVVTSKDGKEFAVSADAVLVCAGRKPNIPTADHMDLKMNGAFIEVNERMETSLKGLYAIGDLIDGYQLAHVAEREGEVAAKNAIGIAETMDGKVIPRCIYTHPEIASVGLTETMAKEQGLAYKIYKQPLAVNSRAAASGDSDGFSKVIVDPEYGEILGMVLVGGNATELINEGSAFMHLEGTVDELRKLIHPHPSYSETITGAIS
jgi:dihydrolipoamide dehydrogenase